MSLGGSDRKPRKFIEKKSGLTQINPVKTVNHCKSLFLTHKYLRETGFAEFAWVSPENLNWSDPDIARGANQLKYSGLTQYCYI